MAHSSSSRHAVAVLHTEEEHLHPGAVSGPQLYSMYIIKCCIEGKGTVFINGKAFPLRPGDAYVLLPGNSGNRPA